MSQLLEFEGTWEELAAHESELRGKKLKLTVLTTDVPQVTMPLGERSLSARELLKLPLEERDRILAMQAALAEQMYRDDPELTVFEAFGEDDFYDEYPADAHNK